MKPPATQTLFRGLILVSAISCLCLALSRWFLWPITPSSTYLALSENGADAIFHFPVWFFWMLGLLWIGAAVGAYMFRLRARLLLAWLVAFVLISQPLRGLVVQTALEAFAGTAGTLATGGALVLAYFTPLRERFERERKIA